MRPPIPSRHLHHKVPQIEVRKNGTLMPFPASASDDNSFNLIKIGSPSLGRNHSSEMTTSNDQMKQRHRHYNEVVPFEEVGRWPLPPTPPTPPLAPNRTSASEVVLFEVERNNGQREEEEENEAKREEAAAHFEKSWIDHSPAWDHFCSVLTSLYALFIIVFAVVVELSQKFTPDEWFSETLFFSYMYGAGIIFLVYCYLFKVHPGWFNRLLAFAKRRKWLQHRYPEALLNGRNGEGAGSLYLRLGTLCFGSSGIVLFCLEIFICHSDRDCFNYQLVNWLLAGLFTFIQMHFIFCNSKLIIVDSKNSAKLGTMHLLAVNIWTWLRFVIAKNAALDRPLDHPASAAFLGQNLIYPLVHATARQRRALPRRMESSESLEFADGMARPMNLSMALERAIAARFPNSKVSSFNYFGDFATLLTTCIVEYSVIGAAVMVTLWRSIDETNAESRLKLIGEGKEQNAGGQQQKTKNGKNVRIDCSASSGGLFAGLLFLIASLVSIGIHSFFSQHEDADGALLVFRLSDMALFCCTLVGCSLGLFRMRSLQYHRTEQQRSSSAEFLDDLLLVIGLVGELIHSSTGVMCWIATQSERAPIKMELYMLFVFITRIVQVVVQAVFILLARRLRALSAKAMREKPGKQFVTFLLIANVSLFFFHTLEGMKSVFGATIATRRARPYAALIVGVAPLVVFYRFHSSVCLAEIWKHCYSAKNGLRAAKLRLDSIGSSNISSTSICAASNSSSGGGRSSNCATSENGTTMMTILSMESATTTTTKRETAKSVGTPRDGTRQ